MGFEQTISAESLFDQSIKTAIGQVECFKDIDVVIGVPFLNEKDILPGVLKIVEKGLEQLHPLRAALILCVGDPAGTEVLEAINLLELKFPHLGFLMKVGSQGRGASIRAILEIAKHLESDVVILAADLKQEGTRGLQPGWISRLLEPIRDEYDLAVASFTRHHNEDVIGSLFLAPLLEAFYGYQMKDPLSGIYAMAHDLVEDYCTEMKFWVDVTRGYGIDPWIITRAIRWNKKICEVQLGAKLAAVSLSKLDYVFQETTRSIFECIKRDEDFWPGDRLIIRTPDAYGEGYEDTPNDVYFPLDDLLQMFKRGYNQYALLYDQVIPEAVRQQIKNTAAPSREQPSGTGLTVLLDSEAWAQSVYGFMFHYWFNPGVCREDLLNALTSTFNGRLAGYFTQMQAAQDRLEGLPAVGRTNLMAAAATALKKEQLTSFLHEKDTFVKKWQEKAQEVKPPLTPAHYLEFIPGIPVVLPKRIEGRAGKVVWTEEIFNQVQSHYQEAFNDFLYNRLQAPGNTGAREIPQFIREFMDNLEKTLEYLLPGDIYTEEGATQVVEGLFRLFSLPRMFSIKTDTLKELLLRFPPLNVIIPAGCRNSRELIEKMDVRDAVSLANLAENRKYVDRTLLWVLDNLSPEGMEELDIRPIVLGSKVLDGSLKQGSVSNLNKITTRITISPLSKGVGGRYPRLYFCLHILRHIVLAEDYSNLWRIYARERKNLGSKIRNSLIGRYETDAFCAHNIFENFHHRGLIRLVRSLAGQLEATGQVEQARVLTMMADSYGLSQILDDGTFVPCSAWTWASYSYKGGKGIPTPLSSHVEEKWFNHDLLEQIHTYLGYDPNEIMHMVGQFIGEGKAGENLLDVLLGAKPKDVIVVPQDTADYPPAQPLVRHPNNPILLPIKEHFWESKYVLNAGAVRIKDRVYLLYRAFGDDEISRIGLAITDGYNVLERLPDPIFVPENEKEKKGCEDPRVVIVDDELYMLYTAYDGSIAQISAASIKIDDFLNRRFDRWKRRGHAFEDIWDKDAILFPEKIRDKYVIYHRIEPSVWVSYMDSLEFPVPKENHSIIFGPRAGRMWDSLKIGAGTQPLKTRYGWLMVYHGVDRNRVYRLGVILVDFSAPERLLYRSPNPVLSPETEHEIGTDDCWVPNVVFTCGAVPAEDKDILDDDDKILVYYGAADTYICLATATVGDLIPEAVRRTLDTGRS